LFVLDELINGILGVLLMIELAHVLLQMPHQIFIQKQIIDQLEIIIMIIEYEEYFHIIMIIEFFVVEVHGIC